jgi:hypothetical protein
MASKIRVHLKGRPSYTGEVVEIREPDPRAQAGSPASERWVHVVWDREDKMVAWSGFLPAARVVGI